MNPSTKTVIEPAEPPYEVRFDVYGNNAGEIDSKAWTELREFIDSWDRPLNHWELQWSALRPRFDALVSDRWRAHVHARYVGPPDPGS